MSDGPDIRDLVGDVEPGELERLVRVDALLRAAGQPPELPPSLAEPPEPPAARVVAFPRRYRFTAVAAAAIVAVALFGAGYLVGGAGEEAPVRTVAMSGQGDARARLAVFEQDDAGNWPMELTVSGLAPLPRGEEYELWLTRDGELADPCGVFAVTGTETTVPLNAPYALREYDGWVVTRAGGEEFVLRTPEV